MPAPQGTNTPSFNMYTYIHDIVKNIFASPQSNNIYFRLLLIHPIPIYLVCK
jgi:hypothetical protein